MIDKQKKMRRG